MNDVARVPSEGDLSDDPIDKFPQYQDKVNKGIWSVANDVQLVRWIHMGAIATTVGVAAVLLCLLFKMVSAFGDHVRDSNDFLISAVTAKPAVADSSGSNFVPENVKKVVLAGKEVGAAKDVTDDSDKADAKSKDDKAAKDGSGRAHLYSMISSYQTNLSTSSVAIISILVIATTVISVAMLRAALEVKPYDPSQSGEKDSKAAAESEKGEGITLPGYDFVKNAADIVLSLFKKKD